MKVEKVQEKPIQDGMKKSIQIHRGLVIPDRKNELSHAISMDQNT